MSNEFLKGVIVGGLVGSSGQKVPPAEETWQQRSERYRAQEQAERDRQRQEQFRQFQAEAHQRQLDRQSQQLSELQLIEGAISDQTAWVEQLISQVIAQKAEVQKLACRIDEGLFDCDGQPVLEKIHETLEETLAVTTESAFTVQQSTIPIEPNFVLHKFLPVLLYKEYLGMTLPSDRLVLPPTWVDFLENEFANPYRPGSPYEKREADGTVSYETPHSCCFVCADVETAALLENLLTTLHNDHIKRHRFSGVWIPPKLVGGMTQNQQGAICVLRDDTGYSAAKTMEYLSKIVRDNEYPIVIDSGPNQRTVNISVDKWTHYYITTNRTKQTNAVAAIFPRQVVLADLMPIQRAAIIGQIVAKYGITLSYTQSRQLLKVAAYHAIAPDALAEWLCREQRDGLLAFVGGTLSLNELANLVF